MTAYKSIKPINSNYDYCQVCGMLWNNCLCDRVEKIASPVEFWLLTTDKESYRPSNTGRFLKLVMGKSVKSFVWRRDQPPKALVTLLESGRYEVVVLFPSQKEEISYIRQMKTKKHKKKVYLLIDATWKEARKILRLSPYLRGCQKVSLEEGLRSRYDFRRGGSAGQLCTYEAGVQVLKEEGEEELAEIGLANFLLYQKAFKATLHGHPMKD